MNRQIATRLKPAWQDKTSSYVISESVYEFDLEANLLKVKDIDFLLVSPARVDGISLPAGTYTVKQIRKSAQAEAFGIFKMDNNWSPETIRGGLHLNTASLICSETDDLKMLQLNVGPNHRFEGGCRYRLDLSYRVSLGGRRRLLLFSGAIQPSDYELARNGFRIEKASKSITVNIFSRKPFAGYIYDAAMMNYFPSPKRAKRDKFGRYQIRGELVRLMGDYGRAQYFTVAAELDG